ncbi:GNAT family N-acetyltransferase [Sphaerisporangium corydalis]|uniref:GNAT family N-acetyltransferase n=1 Tax=Sphaerisporangium corydalis TaxID=1441875 RepID=A0ABV9ESU5_9ACTN|nr:GNAT family N-acetyltransferase [Sphaerisporangium corydalis]
MGDTVIRRAEISDVRALAELRWRFKTEDEDAGIPQDEAEFVAGCQEWLRARIAGPWRAWLAEGDGRPCGHVFLCLVEKVPSPYPGPDMLGYVTNFYVTPERRDQGIGGALMTALNRYAHDHDLDTLIVWPSHRSAPLYRRHGYDSPTELLELPIAPT